MAEASFPWASVSGDRAYGVADWAEYFGSFLTNGVFPTGDALQLTAATGMTATLSAGNALLNGGYLYANSTDLTLTFGASDGALGRIDNVVIQWQRANRQIVAIVKTGTPASTPAAPELVRSADYWELCVATVSIPAGIAAITSAHISDKRLNTDLCGIVSSLITPDTEGWYDAWEAEFMAWFNGAKNTLGEDTAGALLNQINLKANKAMEYTGTLAAASWTGTEAPYEQTVPVAGLTDTGKRPVVDLVPSSTYATALLEEEAWGNVVSITIGDGSITAKFKEKPAVDLNITIKVVD